MKKITSLFLVPMLMVGISLLSVTSCKKDKVDEPDQVTDLATGIINKWSYADIRYAVSTGSTITDAFIIATIESYIDEFTPFTKGSLIEFKADSTLIVTQDSTILNGAYTINNDTKILTTLINNMSGKYIIAINGPILTATIDKNILMELLANTDADLSILQNSSTTVNIELILNKQ